MRHPARLASLLAFLSLMAAASCASAATIAGQVFTAESPDSTVHGAAVTLMFPSGSGSDMKRVEGKTDAEGHFHFLDLSPDTSIAYVLQITFRGRDFLSNQIRFATGQNQIDYNVLLSDSPPAGDSQEPPMIPGKPARQSPVHTILIVLVVVMLYSLFAALARRQDGGEGREAPPEARALIREIASLDVRHDDGIIGEEEYRKVRAALMGRLRSLSQRPTESTG